MNQKNNRAGYKLTARIAVENAIKTCRARGDIPQAGMLNDDQFRKLFLECQRNYPFKNDLHHLNYSLWCEVRDSLIKPLQAKKEMSKLDKTTEQLSLFQDL